jgi:hypothetical protein
MTTTETTSAARTAAPVSVMQCRCPASKPHRPHIPLSTLDQVGAARAAGRVLDVPGRRKNPVTFDSGL